MDNPKSLSFLYIILNIIINLWIDSAGVKPRAPPNADNCSATGLCPLPQFPMLLFT